jgi:hypothetical protein
MLKGDKKQKCRIGDINGRNNRIKESEVTKDEIYGSIRDAIRKNGVLD